MILFPSFILLTNIVQPALDTPKVERIQVNISRNLLNSTPVTSNNVQTLNSEQQISLDRSIADWLNQMPGVSMNGQGGLMQSYSIRGLSKARIRTEVDGIPITTDRRAGNSISFIPTSLLSDAVVQKGASSTLYGSDAMGGVISLSSISPQELNASMSQQTNGNQSDISISNGNDAIQAGAAYRKAKNSQAANGKELHTEFEQAAGLIKYQTDFSDFNTQTSFLISETTDIGKSSSNFPDKKVTIYPSEIHSLSQFQLSYQDLWLVKLYHHYQNWESQVDRINSRTNKTFYQAHTIGSLFYSHHNLHTGKGRYGIEWVGRRGIKISEQEYDLSHTLTFEKSLLDGNQDNFGLFIDEHWQYDDFKFMTGLRFDSIKQTNQITHTARHDSKLNSSLSTSYLVSDQFDIHAEYGTGFRFPTLSELYFNGETPRGTTLGNKDLKSETSKSYAIDLNYHFKNSKLSLSTYLQHLDNYIQRYRVNSDLRSYQNIDEARIKGFELSYEFQVTDNFTHQVLYQKQIGTDSDEQTLADLLPAKWTLNSQWFLNRASILSSISYRKEKSDIADGEQALNSVLLWDLKWRYHLSDQFNLSLSANNLLDKLYYGTADEDADFQPGRSFGISINYQSE